MVSVGDIVARRAARDELERAERMRRAWAAYMGDMPKPLRVRPGEYDDNVQVNFARVIVDKGVSFLFGGGVAMRVDGSSKAAAWLDRVWEASRKATLLHRLAVNGGVCGHAFLKIARDGASGIPRLIVLDPMTVSVRWRPDDWEEIVEYRLQWHGVDPASGRPRAYRQLITRHGDRAWDITDQVSEGDDPRWMTIRVDRWPYRRPPIVACQNLPAPNEYWGHSDLEDDVLGVCRSLNFVLSNAVRIVRLHAHPRLWGVGFTPRDLPTEPGDVTVLPDTASALHLLETRSGLGSSLELYARLRDALHEMARIPDPLVSGAPSARLSGVALRMLHQPLIEKTQTKRLLYGEMLADLGSLLLEVGGFGAGHTVTIEWPAVTPTDPYEEARTAALLRDLGADADQLLRRFDLTTSRGETPCPASSI